MGPLTLLRDYVLRVEYHQPDKRGKASWLRKRPSPVRRPSRRFPRLGNHQRGMGIGTPGSHFRSHPNRLHQLLLRGARAQRRLGVPANAVRALRDMGDGHGNDLLGLGG